MPLPNACDGLSHSFGNVASTLLLTSVISNVIIINVVISIVMPFKEFHIKTRLFYVKEKKLSTIADQGRKKVDTTRHS